MSQTKAQLIDPVDGTIVNADINASAAIAGSKISPDFGSQDITTTGDLTISGGDFILNGTYPNIRLIDTNNDSDYRLANANGDFQIYDISNSATRLNIDGNTGNIGIGTESPSARLHVLEDIYAKGSSGDGTVGIQIRSGGSAISDQHQIRTGGGTGQQIFIEALGSSSAVVTKVNSSERMRIDSSGRVLIGTTTEGYASADDLTVATSGNTGITIRSGTGNLGTLAFSDGTSGTAEYDGYIQYSQDQNYMDFATGGGNIRARIASDGKVGIGTVSPATNLHVSSSGDTIVRVTSADGNAAFLDLGDASDPDGGRIHYDSGSNLVFNTASSERMRIDSSGRLLIATTAATGASTNADDLKIGNTDSGSQRGLTIGSALACNIRFADAADDTAGAIIYNHSLNNIAFTAGSSQRATIDADGIKFGSDTAAANALDDYEEGTFTAVCANSVTLHASQDLCMYTRIGRSVTVRGQIRVNNDNGGNENLIITNAPFINVSGTDGSASTVGAVRIWDQNVPSNTIDVVCEMFGGSNHINFWINRDDQGAERMKANSNAYSLFTITYFTS